MRPLSRGSFALLPIIFVLLGSASNAADFGARPSWGRPLAYDWSGLHVGITGGGA